MTDGASAKTVNALVAAVKAAGAVHEIIGPKVGGAKLDDGTMLPADQKVDGGPSILYDAVAVVVSADGAKLLSKDKTAKDFVNDAFGHCKFIGYTAEAKPFLAKAGIADEDMDDGVIALTDGAADAFVKTCGQLRLWDRELDVDLDADAFLAPDAA